MVVSPICGMTWTQTPSADRTSQRKGGGALLFAACLDEFDGRDHAQTPEGGPSGQ